MFNFVLTMFRYFWLIVFICNSVTSEDCVTVDFEDNFENDFTINEGLCIGLLPWEVRSYSSVYDSPNAKSTKFITPLAGVSCVSSFAFTMSGGGTLEVNAYTLGASPFDQLTVRVFQSITGGRDLLISTTVHNLNSQPVWEILSLTIEEQNSFQGYVTFQSLILSTNTVIRIDSFRYIGPLSDKDQCVIYENIQNTTTTTEATTITSTEATTVLTTKEPPIDECVTSNFEYNFEQDFTNEYGVCIGLSSWNLKNYSSVNLDGPHPISTKFISPQTGVSCVSSFNFTMTAGGVLEVYVYTMPVSAADQLTIRIFQSVDGGNDILIGTELHTTTPVSDWETIRMTIKGNGSFEGYVVFQAWTASSNPVLWIDSFRYIGPSFDKDSCLIYNELTTTVEPTTTETPNIDCVTANFEYNFEDDFTVDYGACIGMSAWYVKQYSSINNFDSPHSRSKNFIAPRTGMSCVSSFNFTMTSGGILEVNVYTMPISVFDILTVRIFQYVVGGNDILVGTELHSINSNPEWEIIRMTVGGNGSFDGYVTFQAWVTSMNPVIWIDSFRYIGPKSNKDVCLIYEEEETTTVQPTTTSKPDDDCVTVDFEKSFEDSFTNNYSVCVGFSPWEVGQYSYLDIESPHPQSTRFITPKTGMSCVSSFKFMVTAGGTLAVNVYSIPFSPFDQLTIRVYQAVNNGTDIIVSTATHVPNLVQEWETINITIDGFGSFALEAYVSYVTFQAWSISPNPIILIDSFRYIAPFYDKDLCTIYDTANEENTTSTTTIPTITTTTESSIVAPNEDCVTVDFESNFENNFTSNYGVCLEFAPWAIQQYMSVGIDSPHPRSTRFIAPGPSLSCVSSFNFTMYAGGMLEVNAFMIATSIIDQLTITVFQTIDGANDVEIGRVFLNSQNSDFISGWQTLNLSLNGPEKFEGFVTFYAMSLSANPIIWIDSFRYIGPSSNIDSCVIYDPAPYDDCVTEDFEDNFNETFTNNNTVCDGLFPWDVKQYSSVDIESPNNRSSSFITPQLGVSCVSSFTFRMTPGGLLEVNAYISEATIHNQLDVSVFEAVDNGIDAFVSGISINHQSSGFTPGWQILHIGVEGNGQFNGYVTFTAITRSANTMTYVDSFRYIGPSANMDSCIIYE